jgi:hypothetical protein
MDAAIGVDLGRDDTTTIAVWPCPCAGCVAARMAVIARNDAERKSLALLCQWLSPEQLTQFEAGLFFEVTGCDTGKRYRIFHGTQMNIGELDEQGGLAIRSWCFQPSGVSATGDVMLAQKIALETYERKALKIANSSPRAGISSVIPWSYALQILSAILVVLTIGLAARCFAEGLYVSLAVNVAAVLVNIWSFFRQFKARARYRRAHLQ